MADTFLDELFERAIDEDGVLGDVLREPGGGDAPPPGERLKSSLARLRKCLDSHPGPPAD